MITVIVVCITKRNIYQFNFLLKTQEADSSWHVKTRSYPFVSYISSGCPHEGDQFISPAGSNWAIMALLLTVNNQQEYEQKSLK